MGTNQGHREHLTARLVESSGMSGDCWYFAYGSNMDPARKECRTGRIRDTRRARLHGYRLTFNKLSCRDGSGKANIVRDEEAEVWGVVYRCSSKAMMELDRCEGAPDHYEGRNVRVTLDSDEEVVAVAYIARDEHLQDGLRPTLDYLQHILAGAKHHRLPPGYIETVERLTGQSLDRSRTEDGTR